MKKTKINSAVNKKITVIIVTYNAENYIYDCLDSLSNQNHSAFDIVIVDNNSTDATCDIIRDFNLDITLISNKLNLGFSRANNAGILEKINGKFGGSDIYILLNQDTIVESNFISEGILAMTQFDLACPKIKYYNSNKIWFGGSYQINKRKDYLKYPLLKIIMPKYVGQFDVGQADAMCEIGYASGCALFINSAVVGKIGLLDESYFFNWETKDYCVSAKQEGFKIGYFPSTTVQHKVFAFKNKLKILKKYSFSKTGYYQIYGLLLFLNKQFGTRFLMLWLLKSPVEVISNLIYFLRMR